MRVILSAALALVAIAATQALALSQPVTVSPGTDTRFTRSADPCPTFSWGEVSEASGYRLLVFELDPELSQPLAVSARSLATGIGAVLEMALPGSATSWTPGLDSCLEIGHRYAWIVGAETDNAVLWSAPSLFRIENDPISPQLEAAFEELLERYISAGRLPELQALLAQNQSGPPAASGSQPSAGTSPDSPASVGEAALLAEHSATSGETHGVLGISHSAGGAGGVFVNDGGGAILKGVTAGGDKLLVDASGAVTANAFILDCESAETFWRDADSDTYGDATRTAEACAAPTSYVSDSTDCDDNDASINPGASEQPGAACSDGKDNDCDTLIDDLDGDCCGGALNTYYRDADGDSYGDPSVTMASCASSPPAGYVSNSHDCNDSSGAIHPGAPELCDGLDNNCVAGIDEGNPGGGGACITSLPGVCSTGTEICSAGSLTCEADNDVTSETCNGLDDDCDGQTDEGNPGGGGACDTGQPGICFAGTQICSAGSLTCEADNTQTAETCNGLDDDCDGATDEGNPDGGGACDTGQPGICSAGTTLCTGGSLTCEANNTATAETCNGDDDDCDGTTDESVDCSHLSDACNVGYCASDIGMCSSAPVGNGTPCDDGLACVVNTTCTNGTCGGGANPCSPPPTECYEPIGACTEEGGGSYSCDYSELPNGTVCDEGLGICVGGECATD